MCKPEISTHKPITKLVRILHLEDVPNDAEVVANTLRREKLAFERLVVDTKEGFLEALDNFEPDIILADHSIPSLNTYDVLAIIYERKIQVPFILVTADVTDEYAADTIKRGVYDYILKDRLGRLPYAIAQALDKQRLERERKGILNDLVREEKRYRALVENGADAIVIFREDISISYASPTITRILGYTEAEALELELSEILHPDDREEVLVRIEACFQNPGVPIEAYTSRIRHKDGTWRWLGGTLTNLLHDPAINGIVDNFRDVTEKKLADEQLIERENQYRQLIQDLPIGIYTTDVKGKIQIYNKAAVDIWGAEPNMETDLFGGSCEIFDSEGKPLPFEQRPIVVALKEERKVTGQEIIIELADGTRKNIAPFPAPQKDTNGRIIGGVNAIIDITDRKEAERKIKDTHHQLQLALSSLNRIMDASLDIICSIDDEGRFVSVSSAAERIWGYKPEELVGRKYMDMVCDEDKGKTEAVAEGLVNGTAVTMFENRYVRKDGSLCPVLWSARWDEQDKMLYGVARDGSEKKRLEKALSDERDRFYKMFLNAPASLGIFKGPDHVFQMANEHYHQITGRKDLVGKTVREAFPEVESQGLFELLDHVYTSGETYIARENLVQIDRNGNGKLEDVYLNFVYQAYRDNNGDIEGVFFFAIDVTEQITSRKRIEDSEKKYRQIVDTAQEGIWALDENATTTFVNRRMCEILEYSEEEMLGKEKVTFLAESEKRRWRKAFSRREAGIMENHECSLITKSGKEIRAYISTYPVFEDGKFMGSLGMVADITERRRAEEEIRFQAHLLNTIGQSVVATDLDGIISYWNKAAEQIYGWKKEEVLGKNVADIIPAEMSMEQARQIMASLRQGNSWSGEFPVKRKDGTQFPAYVTDTPIYGQDNKPKGVIGISTDISELKRLEDLLDKASRMARVGNYELDLVRNELFWSPVTKEIHEVDKDFVPDVETGINFYKEGESRRLITKAVLDAVEDNVPFDLELEIVTARGNERWVRVMGASEWKDGKCVKMYGSFQDIDMMKCAEQEILKTYQEKNTILESIGDAFFTVDRDWIVTYWNKEAERLLGQPRSEIIGKNLWEVYGEEGHSEYYKQYHNAASSGQIAKFIEYYPPVNKWLEVSAYPSPEGLSIFFRDISERVVAEKQLNDLNETLRKNAKELEISNAELEHFAYVASHDLQEPLRMVTSFLSMIEKKYGGLLDDKGKQYIYFAVDGARRMRQIILDLLEYSRVGKSGGDLGMVALDEVVSSVIALNKKQIEEKGARLEFEGLPVIKTHKTPVHQVFRNLISNALKYHKPGVSPTIEIGCTDMDTYWQLSVKDNGLGIEEEYFEKIFIIFQRLHKKEEYDGVGLGLALCKKIIERLNGTIWVESKTGLGSTFFFTIPKEL